MGDTVGPGKGFVAVRYGAGVSLHGLRTLDFSHISFTICCFSPTSFAIADLCRCPLDSLQLQRDFSIFQVNRSRVNEMKLRMKSSRVRWFLLEDIAVGVLRVS